MRTPNLQYLYLQKPITFVVVLCIISLLPWSILGDFSANVDAVAATMLESGNWILPSVNATDFTYNPPLTHWLIALFSYPQGYVSGFTSHLPSAIAFVWFIASVLMFFGKRVKFQQAFIAVLFLLTCFEMHRAGLTSGMDMLFSFFVVLGMFRLYKWEESLHLKGLPVIIPFYLSCAILTKGPIGAIVPLFVFGVYLLVLNKYSLLTVFKALFYIGVASLFLPLLWYIAAWKQGGNEFLNLILEENLRYFFSIGNTENAMGHSGGIGYNFQALLIGFIPWTLLFVFSLLGIKLSKPDKSLKEYLKNVWTRFRSQDKVVIFSVVVIVCVFFFYSIPATKRSIYLIPAYPFIALFLAQYALYLTEYRRLVTRFFAGFFVGLVSVFIFVLPLVLTGVLNLPFDFVNVLEDALTSPSWFMLVILLLNLLAVIVVWYQLFKKINIKILYATIALTFTVNLLIDGVMALSLCIK